MEEKKTIPDTDVQYALLPTDDQDEKTEDGKLVEITEFRDHEHATTDFETLLHIVKATIGSGILNLPAAVRNAGVAIGPVGLLFVAIITVHCEHLLVISSRAWCRVRRKSSMDFADVGGECMMTRYPNKGWLGRLIVNVCLMFAQFGFCCVYMLFVCRNLQQLFANNVGFDVDTKFWILMLLPIYILLSFIKNLDSLAWLSFVSNVLMITGFTCIFVHIFATLHNPNELPAVAPLHKLPLFFASSIFTYESIGLILPLENEIKNPKRFPPLLNLGMAFVSFLYISMGFFGYLSCTSECKGSITLNLGETPFSIIVRSVMSVSIFLTFFIQAYVPISLIESWVFEHTAEKHKVLKSCGVRTGVVIFSAILASSIPHLEYIIAFFGATTSTTLSITLPPILHSISVSKLSKFTLGKNIVIIIFGICVTILGTGVAIDNIIQLYQQPVLLAGKE